MSSISLTNPSHFLNQYFFFFFFAGGAATVAALVMGIYNLQVGNSYKQQIFMRARIGAQGFTVLALVLGVVYHQNKKWRDYLIDWL